MLAINIYSSFSIEISAAMYPLYGEALKGWEQYLEVALPGTVIFCSLMWAMELNIIFAGVTGVNQLTAYIVVWSITTISITVP